MTERLYYTDAYLHAFDATVVEHDPTGTRVYLDRTAFYPTSGGQPHDTGTLGGARVLDVVDESDRIAHLLDEPVAPGPVSGRVDWSRRLDHMQQHTGQHLLSAVIAELFGHATTSVHFGAAGSTLDLDAAGFPHDRVVAAEERANDVVMENRPVEVGFEDAATATRLRKDSARSGNLRVVTIPGLDRSACGGTHVRATGEIGPVLIRRVERVRRSVRLEFLCGRRAVRRARADADLLARLAAPYSAAVDELPELLERQRAELKGALATRRELETALDARRARELYETAATGRAGTRWVVVRAEREMSMDRLRGLARAVIAFPAAAFVGTAGEPPAVLLASAEDAGIDAGAALRATLERAGGRGGGGPRMAQGSVPDGRMDAVVAALLDLPS